MDRPCTYCGNAMSSRVRTRAKFCSVACKDKARNEARAAATRASRPERTCPVCGQALAVSKHSHAITCSQVCAWKYQNRLKAAERTADRRKRLGPCLVCGTQIPATRRADSLYCSKECRKTELDARWRAKSPGYMRQYLYGITPEQYAERLAAQDGRCAICRTDVPGGKGGWHVDHDHATNSIRGLLCHACNVALGNFNDDPARLQAAIAYLNR